MHNLGSGGSAAICHQLQLLGNAWHGSYKYRQLSLSFVWYTTYDLLWFRRVNLHCALQSTRFSPALRLLTSKSSYELAKVCAAIIWHLINTIPHINANCTSEKRSNPPMWLQLVIKCTEPPAQHSANDKPLMLVGPIISSYWQVGLFIIEGHMSLPESEFLHIRY